MTSPEINNEGSFKVESDPRYLNFQGVEVTEVDDTKPWKPATKVNVTKADGSTEEIDANTPFFKFADADLNELSVTAAAAGHIDDLHIKGTDEGSKFDYPSLDALFNDVEGKLPEGIASSPGVSDFSMEMGKNMGKEGVASMQELAEEGIVSEADIAAVETAREEVQNLNKTGDEEARNAFVEKFKTENPDCKVQFQVVRGAVIVPTVDTPKRPTTKLFMVFGPAEGIKGKSMYTAAPGRWMPRHPNPTQFREEEGGTEGEAYKKASDTWFNTVMLIG